MKRKILFATLITCSGLFFSACQDEEEFKISDEARWENSNIENSMGRVVPDTVSYTLPISKVVPYISVGDSVCFWEPTSEDFSHCDVYRTIKICNVNRSIMQEWILDDFHSKSWFPTGCYCRPNDPDGISHGCYYVWEGVMSDAGYLWDYAFQNSSGQTESGFRIPNITDYRNLATVVGGANYARQVLQLKYDGVYYNDGNFFTNSSADLWINPYDPINWSNPSHMDLGRVDGCGILQKWSANDPDRNGYMPVYTNDPHICAKVRLVRDLTVSTW